jgi:non-specific serine/threonine protein kinase
MDTASTDASLPGNILMAAHAGGWSVRLTDFGVGSLVDKERLLNLGISLSATETTRFDGLSGTPPYIAPEILRGQAPTAQCDVYALGIILYQLLCGDLRKSLSPGWERDVADALLREDIAAATDGDPMRRIASAVELADRIRRLEQRRAAQVQFSYADALKMTSRFSEAQSQATELLARQSARLGTHHPQPCYTSVLVASVQGYTGADIDSAPARCRP